MGEEITSSYSAGFFDGEGSVYAAIRRVRDQCPSIIVCISNTHEGVLRAHMEKWGGSIHKRSVVKERHRQLWQWVIAPKKARVYLLDVMPFLIIKKEVAEKALELIDLQLLPRKERIDYTNLIRSGHRWRHSPRIRPEHHARVVACHDKIREINARGYNALRSHG